MVARAQRPELVEGPGLQILGQGPGRRVGGEPRPGGVGGVAVPPPEPGGNGPLHQREEPVQVLGQFAGLEGGPHRDHPAADVDTDGGGDDGVGGGDDRADGGADAHVGVGHESHVPGHRCQARRPLRLIDGAGLDVAGPALELVGECVGHDPDPLVGSMIGDRPVRRQRLLFPLLGIRPPWMEVAPSVKAHHEHRATLVVGLCPPDLSLGQRRHHGSSATRARVASSSPAVSIVSLGMAPTGIDDRPPGALPPVLGNQRFEAPPHGIGASSCDAFSHEDVHLRQKSVIHLRHESCQAFMRSNLCCGSAGTRARVRLGTRHRRRRRQ